MRRLSRSRVGIHTPMSGRRVANSQTDTPLGGLGVNASVSIEQALRVTNVCRSFQHVCLYLATRCRSECSSVRVLHCDRFRVHFCEIKVVSYADDVDVFVSTKAACARESLLLPPFIRKRVVLSTSANVQISGSVTGPPHPNLLCSTLNEQLSLQSISSECHRALPAQQSSIE